MKSCKLVHRKTLMINFVAKNIKEPNHN